VRSGQPERPLHVELLNSSAKVWIARSSAKNTELQHAGWVEASSPREIFSRKKIQNAQSGKRKAAEVMFMYAFTRLCVQPCVTFMYAL
jgi:hypothetical protein